MAEIIGYIVMVCGGFILAALTLVGAIYVAFWTFSCAWDSVMWTNPNAGFIWERPAQNGRDRVRLWFCGLKVGRFGVGIMGSKRVEQQEPRDEKAK